jgi:glycosyltransferase involved in cell wall biosynthesis
MAGCCMHSTEIWLLTPGFPAHEGEENCIPPLQKLALELHKNPLLKVRILTTQYPFGYGQYLWNGIPVWSCGGQNRRGIHKIWTLCKAFYLLVRFSRKASVWHGFWLFECAWLSGLMAWLYRRKAVWTIQGQDGREGNRYFSLLPLFRKRAILIGLSDFVARKTKAHSGLVADGVIPYGMDLEDLPMPNLKKGWDVLGVGSLVPVKNQSLFVEIVWKLKQSFPQIQACLAGSGPELDRLQALALELGLESNLRFLGELPRQDVLVLMGRSKVFLHTSDWEGQGFVLAEALAMGCAVVSTPVGFLPRLPQTAQGKNSDELVNKVSHFLLQGEPNEPWVGWTMHQTAQSYVQLYVLKDFAKPLQLDLNCAYFGS